MNSQDGTPPIPNWKARYRAALLEADATKLPSKIRAAEQAVLEELRALTRSATGKEYEALYAALNALADLQCMYEKGVRESAQKGDAQK